MNNKTQKLHYYSDEEYDAWDTIEDGTVHHWVYVKHYKELLEVTEDDKRAIESLGRDRKRKQANEYKRGGPDISLSTIAAEGDGESWLVDQHNTEDEVIVKLMEEDFVGSLTQKQSEVYLNVMADGETNSEFARKTHRSEVTVRGLVTTVREKFKKYFD